ncbi:hypothetical protein [Desertivirga xinjiangensis]|uniref:hypothetical protein n=1 Tax=Desertivirga xinjiangensis TaxID=539206 RepID=UPI00210A377A|nr:hypothetical protein [Pedobacter xinjiangensis]
MVHHLQSFYISLPGKKLLLLAGLTFMIFYAAKPSAAVNARLAKGPYDSDSLILIRTSGADKIQAIGAIAQLDFEPFGCRVYNGSISQFLQGLKVSYLKDSRLTLIDGTGYIGQIDLLLDTPLNTIEELNKALAPYDLRFIHKKLLGDRKTNPDKN